MNKKRKIDNDSLQAQLAEERKKSKKLEEILKKEREKKVKYRRYAKKERENTKNLEENLKNEREKKEMSMLSSYIRNFRDLHTFYSAIPGSRRGTSSVDVTAKEKDPLKVQFIADMMEKVDIEVDNIPIKGVVLKPKLNDKESYQHVDFEQYEKIFDGAKISKKYLVAAKYFQKIVALFEKNDIKIIEKRDIHPISVCLLHYVMYQVKKKLIDKDKNLIHLYVENLPNLGIPKVIKNDKKGKKLYEKMYNFALQLSSVKINTESGRNPDGLIYAHFLNKSGNLDLMSCQQNYPIFSVEMKAKLNETKEREALAESIRDFAVSFDDVEFRFDRQRLHGMSVVSNGLDWKKISVLFDYSSNSGRCITVKNNNLVSENEKRPSLASVSDYLVNIVLERFKILRNETSESSELWNPNRIRLLESEISTILSIRDDYFICQVDKMVYKCNLKFEKCDRLESELDIWMKLRSKNIIGLCYAKQVKFDSEISFQNINSKLDKENKFVRILEYEGNGISLDRICFCFPRSPDGAMLTEETNYRTAIYDFVIPKIRIILKNLHANGLTFNDLHPANILLRPKNEQELLKFGKIISIQDLEKNFDVLLIDVESVRDIFPKNASVEEKNEIRKGIFLRRKFCSKKSCTKKGDFECLAKIAAWILDFEGFYLHDIRTEPAQNGKKQNSYPKTNIVDNILNQFYLKVKTLSDNLS